MTKPIFPGSVHQTGYVTHLRLMYGVDLLRASFLQQPDFELRGRDGDINRGSIYKLMHSFFEQSICTNITSS